MEINGEKNQIRDLKHILTSNRNKTLKKYIYNLKSYIVIMSRDSDRHGLDDVHGYGTCLNYLKNDVLLGDRRVQFLRACSRIRIRHSCRGTSRTNDENFRVDINVFPFFIISAFLFRLIQHTFVFSS